MTRLSVSVVLIMLCFALQSCKGHTTESLNEEGQKLLQQGNYNGAIVHFKNALEKDPNFVEARYNLGRAYIETGKFEQAERELQKVKLQNPSERRADFQLARIANFQNRPAEALPLLREYLKHAPEDPAALEQLAMAETISGDLQSARQHLMKVLEIEPGRLTAKLALIHNYINLGEGGKAREAIDALLARDPGNRLALHALAQLESAEQNPDAMLDVYSRISAGHPGDLFARYKEGTLLMGKGESEAVRASAESMIKEFPKRAEGHRLMGLYLSREGRYDEAVTALNTSLRLQPDLETYYLLGLAYYQTGNLEMAVTQFQTVIDYSPEFFQARMMIGEIFLRQGRGEEALRVADKLIETNPEDFRGPGLKADALMLTGKPSEALAEYRKAIGMAPNHYGMLLKAGLLRLSLGDMGGEQDLLEALRSSPQGLDARMALHALYLRTGRSDEAFSVLLEGLSGGKSDAVIHNALAKASLGRKDGEGAESHLLKAREADPTFLQTYYNAAVLKLSRGKAEEAVAQYDQALAVKPDDVRALISSATVLERLGKPDEARLRLEKASETGNTEAILRLASFLAAQGQQDGAISLLEAELRKNPSAVDLLKAKARLHLSRGETDKAMSLYGQLEAADPWGGNLERTLAWMSLGDLDRAEETARKLIALSGDRGLSYQPLAAIQERRGDRDAAMTTLKKAMEVEPANPQLGVFLGEFLLRGKDFAGALEVFESVLAASPLNAPALTGKGMTLQFMGKREEAAMAYLQAVQVKQDHVPALNNLAMLWADAENTRLQAVNLAMAAYVRSNSDPSVIDTLGYTLIRSGRSAEAVKVLERAMALAPGNPVIVYHLALAHAEQGNAQKARELLESALGMSDFGERDDAVRLMESLPKG